MSTGTLIYIVAMGFTVVIFGGITYLLKKQGDFSIISGFSNRPEAEKEYLEKSGYLKAITSIFNYAFWILLITFISGLLPIPYLFEIGMAIFILYLMIGLIWVQQFEVPTKRKKMTWVMSGIAVFTFVFIGWVTIIGYMDNEISITKDSLTISGSYGDTWAKSDIKEFTMMNELPEVIAKTNGYAMTGVLKGNFNVEKPYGGSLLFIQDRSQPVLYIQVNDEHIFIGKKNTQDTKAIYEALKENRTYP